MTEEKQPEYCIFSPGDGQGFLLGEMRHTIELVHMGEGKPEKGWYVAVGKAGGYHVPTSRIIARHINPAILTLRLLAAQAREKEIRPYWQAALEHSLRLEQMMHDEVLKIARGE